MRKSLNKIQPVIEELKRYRKKKIPAALREQVWLHNAGKVYETKCYVRWCLNKITVNDFQCGHDIPESKGGKTELSNLFPICCRCNSSMSNNYTLKEWNNSQKTQVPKMKWWRRVLCWFSPKNKSTPQ